MCSGLVLYVAGHARWQHESTSAHTHLQAKGVIYYFGGGAAKDDGDVTLQDRVKEEAPEHGHVVILS